MNQEFHKSTVVLVIELNGENRIFKSIRDCCKYFFSLGKIVKEKTIKNLIETGDTLSLIEEWKDKQGDTHMEIRQFCFDEIVN